MSRTIDRDEEIFANALARPKAERAAYLPQACEGDAAWLARVAALVAAHEGGGSLMSSAPHPCIFTRTSFSPDGNVLGSSDNGTGRVHIWRAPSQAEIDAAEKTPVTMWRIP